MEEDPPGKCKIWHTDCSLVEARTGYLVLDSSRAGGLYKIFNNAILKMKGVSEEIKVQVTNWLVEERRSGNSCPTLDEEVLESAMGVVVPSVSKRRDMLLLWLEKSTGSIGRKLYIGSDGSRGGTQGARDAKSDNIAMAEASCMNIVELRELVEFGIETGFIFTDYRMPRQPQTISLSFKGYEKIEELRISQVSSVQGFVAMWFNAETDVAYEQGIKLGIEDAGYKPLRIDRTEHNNKIDDEIIAEIRRSKFVVADFTSEVISKQNSGGTYDQIAVARGGVYFEAGFAKGLGREVIWTVREDLLPMVHFDTRQFAHIVWKDAADLRSKLAKRISATMGDGPLRK